MRIINVEDEYIEKEASAVALGFFDGVHRGHAQVVRAAKSFGLKTVVLTFSRRPADLLSGSSTPLITSKELKEEALASLGTDTLIYMDFLKLKDYSAEEFVKKVLVDKLNAREAVCGFNYRFGKSGVSGARELKDLCRKYGTHAVALPPVCEGGLPVSSSRIRALLQKGDIVQANRLLGRPFSLKLEVIHGRMLGRTLGFPTINQKLPGLQIAPLFGVYATRTAVHGSLVPSVTNVGVKPTVGSSDVLAETYISGFGGDLYGKTVEVFFTDFIRRERKFPSLAELRRQIIRDSEISQKKNGTICKTGD